MNKTLGVLTLAALMLTGCANFLTPQGDSTPKGDSIPKVKGLRVAVNAATNQVNVSWTRNSASETYILEQECVVDEAGTLGWVSVSDNLAAAQYSLDIEKRELFAMLASQDYAYTFRVKAVQGSKQSVWSDETTAVVTYWLTNQVDFTVQSLGANRYRGELRLRNSGNVTVNRFSAMWMAATSTSSNVASDSFDLQDLGVAPGQDVVLDTGQFTATDPVTAIRLYWSWTKFSN